MGDLLKPGSESRFSDDADLWFARVARRDRSRRPDLLEQELLRISKMVPSRRNFDRFARIASKMQGANVLATALSQPEPYSYAKELTWFIDKMKSGSYLSEFRRFASPRADTQHVHYCSQVSELFSFFQQAWRYDEVHPRRG